MAITLEQWAARLTEEAGGAMRDRLAKDLRAIALKAERRAKVNATGRPRVRTGRLRNSIRGDVTQSGDHLAVRLSAGGVGGRDLAYAAAQEEGATIRPRRGRYLAIPLPGALTPAGALRARFAVPGGLRAVASLFAVRSKRGNLLLVERKGQEILPMFVLHRGPIRISPTRFLSRALEDARDELPEALREAVVVAVGGT